MKKGRKEGRKVGERTYLFLLSWRSFWKWRGLYDIHIAFSLPGSLSAELFTRLSDSLQGHSHPRGSKTLLFGPLFELSLQVIFIQQILTRSCSVPGITASLLRLKDFQSWKDWKAFSWFLMVLSILCQSSSFPISRGEHRQKAEIWPEKVISFRCTSYSLFGLSWVIYSCVPGPALWCRELWRLGGGRRWGHRIPPSSMCVCVCLCVMDLHGNIKAFVQ